MAYIKWTFRIVLIAIVGGFLHYVLPQRDIVRVVNTYEERQDFGGFSDIFWQNTAGETADAPVSRDVLYLQTVQPDGSPMVYRNQDTGWGWPFYFKFDTADLQTNAVVCGAPLWLAQHLAWRRHISKRAFDETRGQSRHSSDPVVQYRVPHNPGDHLPQHLAVMAQFPSRADRPGL
jgi:hypothetical protein